jgi:hypothetical protein
MLMWKVLRVLVGRPLLPMDCICSKLDASPKRLDYVITMLEGVGLTKRGSSGGESFAWPTYRGIRFAVRYLSEVSHPAVPASVRAPSLIGRTSRRPFIPRIEMELTKKSPAEMRRRLDERLRHA